MLFFHLFKYLVLASDWVVFFELNLSFNLLAILARVIGIGRFR